MFERIKYFCIRLKYRCILIRDHDRELNKRVAVECQLLSMASGKLPLPDADKCKELAFKLGIGE